MAVRKTWDSKFKAGETAPDFEVVLHDKSVLSSKSLKGKPVVLFFYNTDGTETCTREACNMRDNYKELIDAIFSRF